MEQPGPKLLQLIKIGLPLFLLSSIIINLFRLPIHWAISNSFTASASLYFFLSVIVAGPIWEEIVFRFSLSKQWWLNRIIMLFYAGLCFWVTQSILFTSVIVLATLVYNLLLNRKDERSVLVFVIFTSLSWAFLHYSNEAPYVFGQLLNVSAIAGLGLIYSYIRLRFSFVAVLFTHIGWNALIVFSTYYYAPSSYNLKKGALEISLTKNSWLSTKDAGSSILSTDNTTEVQNAVLAEIIELFLPKSPTNNYHIKPTFAKYSGHFQVDIQSPAEVGKIFNLTVDSNLTLVNGYSLTIEKTDTVSKIANHQIEYKAGYEIVRNTVSGILTKIANDYDVPVKIIGDSQIQHHIVTVQYPSNLKSFQEVINYLNSNLDLDMSLQPAQLSLKKYYFY